MRWFEAKPQPTVTSGGDSGLPFYLVRYRSSVLTNGKSPTVKREDWGPKAKNAQQHWGVP